MPKKKKKRPEGRPTKYRPEYCQAIIRFFNIEPIIYKDMTITKPDGIQVDKSVPEAVDLPFFEDFADTVGVAHDTLLDWTKKYPEFGEAYKRAKKFQEKILITCGLKGLYAPAFTIFTMKNVCGWRDVVEQKHSGEVKSSQSIIVVIPPERKKDYDNRISGALRNTEIPA